MLLKHRGILIKSLGVPFALSSTVEFVGRTPDSLPSPWILPALSCCDSEALFQVPPALPHQQPHILIPRKHLSRDLQSGKLFFLGIFNNWLEEVSGPSASL